MTRDELIQHCEELQKQEDIKRVELLCEDLKQSLSNPNGVMSYDEICNHDDRFLCECRINWICAHIKKAFE